MDKKNQEKAKARQTYEVDNRQARSEKRVRTNDKLVAKEREQRKPRPNG